MFSNSLSNSPRSATSVTSLVTQTRLTLIPAIIGWATIPVAMMRTIMSTIPLSMAISQADSDLRIAGTLPAEGPIASGSTGGIGASRPQILDSATDGTGTATISSSTKILIMTAGIWPTTSVSAPMYTSRILDLNRVFA